MSMPVNPHFSALFTQKVFAGRKFGNAADFYAHILQAGMYLGTIRVHGLNFRFVMPSFGDDAIVQEALGINPRIPLGADSMFVIHDALKYPLTLKTLFRSETVPLIEICPWERYRQAQKLAENEGARQFLTKRQRLARAIDTVALVRTRSLQVTVNATQESGFTDTLSSAWEEHREAR